MTPAQRASYWRAFSAACQELGLHSTADREAYRKEVMHTELGVDSSSEINNTDGFEKIMIRFWHDADRDDMALRFMAGDARRLGAVAISLASDLTKSSPATSPQAYIFGILKQMRIQTATLRTDDWFLDIPEQTTIRVIQVLDSHRRRHERKAH